MSSVATIGSTTGIVTGISGGTAYITYTLPATGCKVDTPVNVVTSPSVITGPASVFIGSPVTLANVVPGGYWSSSNTSIATVGLTSGYLSGVSVGAATISYTTGGSCRITKNITVMPMKAGSHSSLLGIDGNRVAGTSTENIGILPNPNKGRFVLSVQWDYEEVITISILNIAGEKVKELPVSAKKDAEIKLDIDLDVPPGVYILSASGKFSSLNSRFIISR